MEVGAVDLEVGAVDFVRPFVKSVGFDVLVVKPPADETFWPQALSIWRLVVEDSFAAAPFLEVDLPQQDPREPELGVTKGADVVDWSREVSSSVLDPGIGVVENTGPIVPWRGSGVSGDGSVGFAVVDLIPFSVYALALHFLPNTNGQSDGISLPLSSPLEDVGAPLWIGGDSSDFSLIVLLRVSDSGEFVAAIEKKCRTKI